MVITPLLAAILLAEQDANTNLIERLRSNDPLEREEATQRLRIKGKDALPELEKAVKDPDPEKNVFVAAQSGPLGS